MYKPVALLLIGLQDSVALHHLDDRPEMGGQEIVGGALDDPQLAGTFAMYCGDDLFHGGLHLEVVVQVMGLLQQTGMPSGRVLRDTERRLAAPE